ncbi:MAG: hypothetical protein JW800_01470 [Candidatus Omnitrophica bacterium]|nr:hypothetical protein [Candidatus Omnitrophota bacterium]
MDVEKNWERALEKTEIIRPRVQELLTYSSTDIPYIFLSESSINVGDTVIRKGSVIAEKPSLILPSGMPRFEGFEFNEDAHKAEDAISHFLLVRGIKFPSLKYNNRTYSLDIYEGQLKKAIEVSLDELQRKEDVITGLVVGPEDCWQFSILIFVCSQIVRSADGDIKRLLENYRKGDRRN